MKGQFTLWKLTNTIETGVRKFGMLYTCKTEKTRMDNVYP